MTVKKLKQKYRKLKMKEKKKERRERKRGGGEKQKQRERKGRERKRGERREKAEHIRKMRTWEHRVFDGIRKNSRRKESFDFARLRNHFLGRDFYGDYPGIREDVHLLVY